MNVGPLHAYLVTLFEDLSITTPVASTIKRCWKYIPPARVAIPETPAVLLTYELEEVAFLIAFLEKKLAIHVQLLVGDASVEADTKADMASAYLDALIDALSGDQRLGGNVSVIRGLRGERETLAALEYGGKTYVGLDLYLDVTLKEARAHAA